MHRRDAEDAERLPLVSPHALRLGGESKKREFGFTGQGS
jgi:hypothetical protein